MHNSSERTEMRKDRKNACCFFIFNCGIAIGTYKNFNILAMLNKYKKTNGLKFNFIL